MLQEVKQATVVITNPTHFAIALRYDLETMGAPVVVAKGQDLVAKQIRQIAQWHDVPMVENPPLARALYRSVDVGSVIPNKLYTAVAEILAFVYRAQAAQRNGGRA
jgi:flagellar biosynthetic protein FlhB